ncbi:MAG: hypothetical protein DHS20C21_23450 [Gemmatimonadota bacterium]|nr:MAG: hypothetical protein DHS20C21_23450 [Gemmatimonadota bacterium]
MATITKQDLVDRISDQLSCRKLDTRKIMQRFLEEITEELAKRNRLEFREFGVFEIKYRAPRKARNPQTGDTVDVPAREVVLFKPGRKLKELAERTVSKNGRHENGSTSLTG